MKRIRNITACLLLSGLGAGVAPGQTNASAWDWGTASPESQGMSSQKLKTMTEALKARSTSGLLVIRNDKIVCEWYAPDAGPTNRHGTASMAKAIVGGMAVAVGITDGRVALDDKASKFIPQWQGDPRKSHITFRHLGSHTSGLADAEIDDLPHEKLTGWPGDFWKRLNPPRDPFTIARDTTPVLCEPGEKFEYSNPGIGMLTYALTAALKDAPQKDVRTLLRERVMRPIGVPDAEWSVGYNQTFTVDGLPIVAAWGGGEYTARAVARIGRLMLRQGNWEGKQLLAPEAVRMVTSDATLPSSVAIGWWHNNKGRYAGLPKDAFWGSGAGHQLVLVVPSVKLVAVRNGRALAPVEPPDDNRRLSYTWFFRPLMEAITDQSAATADAR
jgi:CubicO group peptidase (beta-lactamase class C family)